MSTRPLSTELQQIAISELNEDPAKQEEDLKLLLKWVEEKSYAHIKTDPQWLLSFLRGCKFDLELVKYKLDLLNNIKSESPELFANRDPFLPEIQEILKSGFCLPLWRPASSVAPLILLCRIGLADPRKIRIEDGIKLASMIADIVLIEDDYCVIFGGHVIVDNAGLTFRHVLQITPSIIKKCLTFFFDAHILKFKAFYVLNVSAIVRFGFRIIKPFLNTEYLNMITFYNSNSMDKFYQTVPLSVLPEEYGGDGCSLEDLTRYWKEKVESYRDWFLNN